MSGLVWLASYPKSGSTWVRMILANLGFPERPASINAPAPGTAAASAREAFDDSTLLASGLLTHDEIGALRPRVEAVAAGAAEAAGAVRFVKAHDLCPPGNEAAGQRALLIVRDPRDVAVSLACHLGVALDETIAAMAEDGFALRATRVSQAPQLRQRVGSWSGHAASWLDQARMPVALIRYEDLEADAGAAMAAALGFAGHEAGRAEIEQAARLASFAELRRQERANGFDEASPDAATPFFRSGRSGAWRSALSTAQIGRIEAEHEAMMDRLGYARSS